MLLFPELGVAALNAALLLVSGRWLASFFAGSYTPFFSASHFSRRRFVKLAMAQARKKYAAR